MRTPRRLLRSECDTLPQQVMSDIERLWHENEVEDLASGTDVGNIIRRAEASKLHFCPIAL